MQRITRICFSLSVPEAWSESGNDRFKKFEFVEGPMGNGECIGSLWFDITSEFITIMMRSTPPGHQDEFIRCFRKIKAYLTSDQEKVAKRHVKKGMGNSTLKTVEEVLALEVDEALGDMQSAVNSIQEIKKIYKVSDLVGPIELTSYMPPLKFEDSHTKA